MESQNQKESIEISLTSPRWSFQKTNTEEWKKQNIYEHPIKEKVQKFNIELFEANKNIEMPLSEKEKIVNQTFESIINELDLKDYDNIDNKNPFVRVYDNALSDDFCDNSINKFENNKDLQLQGTTSKEPNNAILYKKTHEIQFINNQKHFKEEDKYVCQQLGLFLEKYAYELPIPRDNYYTMIGCNDTGYQIQKYKKNNGYYYFRADDKIETLMKDNKISKFSLRTLTFIFYLNDIDEGGETLFTSFKIKPKKGRLLFFPATWDYIYADNIPKSDDKYIITGWIVKYCDL